MLQLIITADGSHTLLNEELNETYHSTKGAMQESEYVFIKQGLTYFFESNNKKSVNILEVGFGTGLNALLSYAFALQNPEISIQYCSLEKYPLDASLTTELNYTEHTSLKSFEKIFHEMHKADWNKHVRFSNNFSLHKSQIDLIHDELPDLNFDLIYFDAFAPSKQVEMWSQAIFEKIKNASKPGSILVSYCASSLFRNNLKAAGFEVEKLPGPPGKREMVRAKITR